MVLAVSTPDAFTDEEATSTADDVIAAATADDFAPAAPDTTFQVGTGKDTAETTAAAV